MQRTNIQIASGKKPTQEKINILRSIEITTANERERELVKKNIKCIAAHTKLVKSVVFDRHEHDRKMCDVSHVPISYIYKTKQQKHVRIASAHKRIADNFLVFRVATKRTQRRVNMVKGKEKKTADQKNLQKKSRRTIHRAFAPLDIAHFSRTNFIQILCAYNQYVFNSME